MNIINIILIKEWIDHKNKMGGVKTCSTGCSKNNPEFIDGQFAANRKMKKKMTGKSMNIESAASMNMKATTD